MSKGGKNNGVGKKPMGRSQGAKRAAQKSKPRSQPSVKPMQEQMPRPLSRQFSGQLRPMGPIHIVGIGGIGMSGIAEVMHGLGYPVRGSDIAENANVQRLRQRGIEVLIGHDGAHVDGAGAVTISSAVKDNNPEVMAARAAGIPVVRRADMLAELMRLTPAITIAGTHGKTTTTSLIAAVLDGGGLDPTVINGGIINAYGTNARMGAGKWMVVEADESDGTFVRLPSTIAVVTNIDPEHLEFYGSYDGIKEAFTDYVENIPFYGTAIACLDHHEVQALVGRVTDRRIVTYGFNAQADIRPDNIRFEGTGQVFDCQIRYKASSDALSIRDIRLPMAGRHNLQNALAAIAVGLELSIAPEHIKAGLAGFVGVKRRFSAIGAFAHAQVIDDYAHHPVEIAAVLATARSISSGRVIAVVQPHRYTRLRDLFFDFCSAFNDADEVIVLPVYEAGETPIAGYAGSDLVDGLRTHGHRTVHYAPDAAELGDRLRAVAGPDDIIICMGAGNITQIAAELVAGGASTQKAGDGA